ncbi:MAG: TVP38/TMEM64 family protein, partial [Methylococcales bacterium]|nr:TVP38/TMEM64 family protein [Methylococcales bacterium]
KLMHVSSALLAHGWRLIAVLRMIPFFPFKLSNYVFGLVPVSFRDYVLGTFIGLWPITIFNVYLGSIAADLVSLGDAAIPRSPFQWFMYVAGFSVSIAALLYLTRLSQRILAEYEAEVDPP